MIDSRRFREFLTFSLEHEALLKKEIQAKYEELVKATEEYDKRKNYAMEKATLDKDVANHQAERKQFLKEKSDYEEKMRAAHEVLTKKDQELVKRDKELAAKQSALISDQADLEANIKATRASLEVRAKELDAQEAKIDSLQRELHKREQELNAKHDRVSKAVATLSELRG